ncbi:hypothetical protein DC313_12490, partial [Neisseria gonorrhoeae]
MNRHSRRFPPTPPISANPADFRQPRRFPSFPRKRESGNPERGRNLSETAETGRTGFPPARE